MGHMAQLVKSLSALPRRNRILPSKVGCSNIDIAVVTLAFEGGGPERDTVLLSNALADRGVRIAILVLHNEGSLRTFLKPEIPVFAVPGRRLRYAVPGLRGLIRSIGPRVVFSSGATNLPTLIAMQSLRSAARPKLLLREVAVPSMAHHDPYRANRIAYKILRYLYRYADRIIVLTDGARRELEQDFSVPESSISVMSVNAAIPPSMVRRLAQWDGETGRERDLIVCVGRLSREKDHRTLLRAMSLMPPECAWRLAIVGDGPDRAALETFVRSNGLADRTVFTGYVTDPFAWMMRARVLVLSSVFEGLPCVLMEALACGTPVVSTDCPYGPREILQDGRYGALTPVGDPAALARAITTALDHVPDRRSLMRRGFEYTAECAAAQFLTITRDLAPRPSVRGPAVTATS
jgi:glycosyltransferase involved in cell wall biosynthesis